MRQRSLLPNPAPSFSDYQEEGAYWLAQRRKAILADDLGLGKTATVILAANIVSPSSVVVLCPKSLIAQWQAEISRFALSPDIYTVLNYERADTAPIAPFVVFDESTYIKNPEAKRTISAITLAMKAEYTYFLTATPVRNNQADLFVPLFAIYPSLQTSHSGDIATDLHRSYKRFLDRFFIVSVNPYTHQTIIKKLAGDQDKVFEAMVNGCMLSRDKTLLELPAFHQRLISVPWAEGQREVYDRVLAGVLEMDDRTVKIVDLLPRMIRLRQVALDPVLCGVSVASGKTDWILQHLDQPTLVFSNFAQYCVRLAAILGYGKASILTGEMTANQRNNEIYRFMSGQTNTFVISAQAGGFGLNLQRATAVVWADLPWTPDVWDQATGRAYRRGQTKEVTEYVLGHPESIDGKLLKVLRRKKNIANETMAMKAVLKELKK